MRCKDRPGAGNTTGWSTDSSGESTDATDSSDYPGTTDAETRPPSKLHSAIGYITPADKLAGREKEIWTNRDCKLEAARERRRLNPTRPPRKRSEATKLRE